MRFLTLALLLACSVPALAGEDEAPGLLPGMAEMKAEAGPADPVQKPDAQKMMAELSSTLRLSSRQEERLSKAITKKSREFEENLEQYGRNSAEEKKWREKMEENRGAMEKINADMPDLIREYLDDEQRDTYDNLLASRNKPREAAQEISPAPAAGAVDGQPRKKRRLVKKKRRLPGAPGAAAKPAAGEPAAAVAPEEEAGGVMVDKEPAQPPAKKKRVLRKKRPAAAPPAEEEPAGPAGAAPTGQEAPAGEEDAGSYP